MILIKRGTENATMDQLIEALTIFRKYGNPAYPTNCSHDVLVICGIEPDLVSKEDTEKLDELGFFVSEEFEAFTSFRFGSA